MFTLKRGKAEDNFKHGFQNKLTNALTLTIEKIVM